MSESAGDITGSPAIEKFLTAIQTATIPACDAWSADATLDATVPNWRLHATGADAIRAEYARWFADPGQFGELRRYPVHADGGRARSWSTRSAGPRTACRTPPITCTCSRCAMI